MDVAQAAPLNSGSILLAGETGPLPKSISFATAVVSVVGQRLFVI